MINKLKNLKNQFAMIVTRILLIFMFIVAGATGIQAQSSGENAIAAAVAARQYQFEVTMIRPSKGGQRSMTGGYTLKLAHDTLSCDLPYMGRVYQASMNSDDAGIKFRSTQFEYKTADRKKGGWNITIKPKDQRNVGAMNLTVFDDGSATLDVTSNDRQPISYSGHISPIHK